MRQKHKEIRKNKAGYTAQDTPRTHLKITGDGPTDRRTDRRTDTTSYRTGKQRKKNKHPKYTYSVILSYPHQKKEEYISAPGGKVGYGGDGEKKDEVEEEEENEENAKGKEEEEEMGPRAMTRSILGIHYSPTR